MSRGAQHALPLPAWPALLTTELACAYLQVGEPSLRLLARKHGIQPREMGGLSMTRWRLKDLDTLVDSLPEKGAEISPETISANDPASAEERALQRAARRRRG